MPTTSQVEALDCASCGAPLEATGPATTVTCSYCGRTMRVSSGTARATDPDAPRQVADDLLRGYQRDVGEGRRYGVGEMSSRGWRADDPHGVWPVEARASTSFGGGWSPHAILGMPRVYPRYGDRAGAWAPRARTSHIEWIEARFPEGVGPVEALRVFETQVAGSAFAVTVSGDHGEEIVWQRRPEALEPGARVLEVPIEPPRAVRSARVYITNSGNAWAEIDTIGLVAAEPVPAHIRTRFRRRRSFGLWIGVAAAVAGVGGFLWLGSLAGSHAREGPAAPLETPGLTRPGAQLRAWPAGRDLATAPVVWAARAPQASSQYGQEQWSPSQAAGPPDTFPAHGDKPTAWASWRKDDGTEWLELRWGGPVDAAAIVILETFNPGALVRVDDLSGDAAAIVWQGVTPPADGARALVIELPGTARISALRLVLDTRLVAGWNEIDAVGLLTEW